MTTIPWDRLTPAEVAYVLANCSHPLGVLAGIPEARRLAAEELGPRTTWPLATPA